MFSIVITEKGGAQRQLDFEGAEVEIGRLEDNDLCLPKSNVSKHHARLVYKDDRYVILDQKSTNGTYVNGRRITSPMVVRKGDKIYIGDFILTLAQSGSEGVAAKEFRALPAAEPKNGTLRTRGQDQQPTISDRPIDPRTMLPRVNSLAAPPPAATISQGARRNSAPPPLPGRTKHGQPPTKPGGRQVSRAAQATTPIEMPPQPPTSERPPRATLPDMTTAAMAGELVSNAKLDEAARGGQTTPAVLAPLIRLQGALSLLMERLAAQMNVARPEESAFPSEHQTTLEQLIDELADEGAIGPDLDRRFLREAAMSEAVGLGPLDRLLGNRAVREIVVDGPQRVLADLGGGLTPVSSFFSDDSAVLTMARRLLHRAGIKLDSSETLHEAPLPDGGWVQVLLPPLSAKGPLIAVRCAQRAASSPESLVTDGVLSNDMLSWLRQCVQQRKNLLVIGPTGAGISHVLSLLTRLAGEHERIVAIEDMPSASLLNAQVLPLARKAEPEVALGEQLRRAALLRYDRLVIDDVQPEESLSVLSAAVANPGALFGMHAATPELALALLESFARALVPGDNRGIRPLLAAAVPYLVHISKDEFGARRVQGISELCHTPSDALELRPLFRYDGTGFVATDPSTSFPGA